MHDDIADHIGILANQVARPARLLRVLVRSDQFKLVIDRAFKPVVGDLAALVAALEQIAAIAIVDVAVTDAQHRPGMRDLVALHVERVLVGAVAGVVDLGILERERTREWSVPRIPCPGQSWMTLLRTVTSCAPWRMQREEPPLMSKPSNTR